MLKFKRKLNIAPPKKEKSHAATPLPPSVQWLLQGIRGKNIILLIQSGTVTQGENDLA